MQEKCMKRDWSLLYLQQDPQKCFWEILLRCERFCLSNSELLTSQLLRSVRLLDQDPILAVCISMLWLERYHCIVNTRYYQPLQYSIPIPKCVVLACRFAYLGKYRCACCRLMLDRHDKVLLLSRNIKAWHAPIRWHGHCGSEHTGHVRAMRDWSTYAAIQIHALLA